MPKLTAMSRTPDGRWGDVMQTNDWGQPWQPYDSAPPYNARVTIRIVRPSATDPRGYIGAQVSFPPRPGENWERGRDLSDGPCSTKTMERIVADLMAFDLPA